MFCQIMQEVAEDESSVFVYPLITVSISKCLKMPHHKSINGNITLPTSEVLRFSKEESLKYHIHLLHKSHASCDITARNWLYYMSVHYDLIQVK